MPEATAPPTVLPARHFRPKHILLPSGLIVAAGIAGWVVLTHQGGQVSQVVSENLIPVTAEPVKVTNVPVYLTGLGTVQALSTVEVEAQVSGVLISTPVHEGQEVHQGDVIAEIDPRPYKALLDEAVAQRAEDAAELKSAQLDLYRYQQLAKHEFGTQQQADEQLGTVDKLLASIQADDAAIEAALLNLGFCTIRAPINGRVSLYQIDAGNLIEVTGQSGILSITQDKPISVVFTLPEDELPNIQRAMARRSLPVVVYASDNTTKLADGVLLTPNNMIDTSSGTIQFKASFPNEDDRLWPGEFVNARVRVDTLAQAITVPLPVIQHGPDGLFVYMLKGDGTAQEQPVRLGYQNDTLAVVTSGLKAGETVIVEGASRLVPGAHVKATGSLLP